MHAHEVAFARSCRAASVATNTARSLACEEPYLNKLLKPLWSSTAAQDWRQQQRSALLADCVEWSSKMGRSSKSI